jgi:O-antigen/teichoic acid export membrane protein
MEGPVSATPPVESAPASAETATRRQIRGSSLLLVGRILSLGINFLVQILIVRYLTKADYGAFAYALSLVGFGASLATFGLDRSVTRFVPIYDEQGEYRKLFGTLVLAVGTVTTLGLLTLVLVYSLQGVLEGSLVSDERAISLLLILVVLSPLQALDGLLMGMFAVFSRPRAIFFRKYVLTPGLRLTVVLLLVLGGQSVFFLAAGYVATAAFGVALYGVLLHRMLREEGLLDRLREGGVQVPAREVLGFTIPLLTSDLVYMTMNTSDVILLGHFGGATDVAAFRVIGPTAHLNQLVMTSFTLLFTPLAARMFARHDREGINRLYWQTAIWIAVLSFPLFALTFSLADPLTVTLFGERYEGSAVYLSLLALGYYFNAALGFNGLVLKIQGKVGYVVVIGLVTIAVSLALNLALIPQYGAMGAAVGMAVAMICHNVLKQAGLLLGTGVRLFEWRYLRVYAVLVTAAVVLFLIQWLVAPSAPLTLVLAALATWVVFRATRTLLELERTFPEILRIPLVRRVLGV